MAACYQKMLMCGVFFWGGGDISKSGQWSLKNKNNNILFRNILCQSPELDIE